MMLPALAQNQRHMADGRSGGTIGLAGRQSFGIVRAATVSRCPVRTAAYHTPSPPGQLDTASSMLPRFSKSGSRGGKGQTSDTNAGHVPPFRVGLARKSSEGRQICPLVKSHSPYVSAAALRPAVTLWGNRPLAGPRSAQVPPPSPAAVWHGVPPSVRQAMSPTVSSTPTNVTDLTSQARPTAARPTRTHSPAQPLLRRGFSVYPTLKRIPHVQ